MTYFLLENGADVNVTSRNYTPLLAAIDSKNLDLIQKIIESGANLQLGELFYYTRRPLCYAYQNKLPLIFDLLIKSGANINSSPTLIQSETYIISAMKRRNYRFAKLLAENKANLDVYELKGSKTPLIMAVQNKRLEIVEVFLENGADFRLREKDGMERTPLLIALQLGFYQIAELLIKSGASLKQEEIRNLKRLPLHLARGLKKNYQRKEENQSLLMSSQRGLLGSNR